MVSFKQYDEASKYFIEGVQRDNDVHKQLELHDVSLGEHLVNKYALWLDFRMGRRIENASEGITLQIEKKEGTAGALNDYIYLIMDAKLNIQNGAYIFAVY